MHPCPDFVLVVFWQLAGGAQSEVGLRLSFLDDLADCVRIQSAIDNVAQLLAQRNVHADVKRPLKFVERVPKLAFLEIEESLQDVRLGVVVSVLDGPLQVQLSTGAASAKEVQARKTGAKVVESRQGLSCVELQREKVEVGDVVEVVAPDCLSQVLHCRFKVAQLRMEQGPVRVKG